MATAGKRRRYVNDKPLDDVTLDEGTEMVRWWDFGEDSEIVILCG